MMRKALIILVFLALFAFLATGCNENTSAKSDETVCVFDGSEHGSQKLKYQIFPGQEPRKSDSNDEVVRIPTSFRFYAAFRDRSRADAGAPEFYLGYAKDNVPVQVEGQDKFRFNTDNACEWYARHGRRNANDGNLGFNARSNESASDFSPWVRWLNENFGSVMAATIKAESKNFTWPELVYGDDPEGPQRSQGVDIAYGKWIGYKFTQRLQESIGGSFFCGTNPEIWEGYEIDKNCPPIFFETGPIKTQDDTLMTQHAATIALQAKANNDALAAKIRADALRKQLAEEAVAAKIRAQRVGSQRRDEKTKQRVLQEQVKTARLQTLSDPDVQKCLVYAKSGLDCDGKWPTKVILGQSGR
jgi:hypothetical protein